MTASPGGTTRKPTVSTGRLPVPEPVIERVTEAHETIKISTEGKRPTVCPATERMQSDLFGICVVGTGGQACEIGPDARTNPMVNFGAIQFRCTTGIQGGSR